MSQNLRRLLITGVTLLLSFAMAQPLSAHDGGGLSQEQAIAKTNDLINKSLGYLKSQQKPDFSWQNEKDPPAITAIVLRCFVRSEQYSYETDFVKKGYEKLLSYQVEDGGIYKDLLAGYNTAIAISALAEAKRDEFKPVIERAVNYLKALQWTPDMSSADGNRLNDSSDAWFGGWGYGGRSRGAGRPDLSNAQMTLDALRDAGVPPTDPAFQNALVFVTRLQNFSETNNQPWAGNDGGFIYGPSDNRKGESFAGEFTDASGNRRLRSYGSMTYAGLKSFIYAGLSKDDPRVKAAWGWISSNWTLTENPGLALADPAMAQSGMYYYYHTLARALNEYDAPVIVDPRGNRHDWRVEFIQRIATLQKPDGSFVGEKRWMEDNPVLVTSYVTLALQEVLKDLKEHPVR